MIGTKSRRPRRRFSLVPHGERSGRLRSRRPRGSLKFPLPSRRLHRVDSTFLPWAPLPSLRRHAAAGAHFHKLARPSATACLRSHHEQQLLHSGLAWLGDQGVKSSSSSTTSSTAPFLSLRSQHRFGARVCVHTPPCFQASCFSPLVPDLLGVHHHHHHHHQHQHLPHHNPRMYARKIVHRPNKRTKLLEAKD